MPTRGRRQPPNQKDGAASVQLTIERMTYGFDAVSHTPEGKTVFVSGGVPGDVVEAHLTSDGKAFSRAAVDGVVDPSPSRVASPCPFAGVCGGCPWSTLAYPAQVQAKRANVVDALARIGKMGQERAEALVGEVVQPSEPWGYRNKVELAVVPAPDGIQLGMHRRAEDEGLLRVDKCLLLAKKYQKLPKSVTGALRFLSSNRDLGLTRVGIRASAITDNVEVALWTDPAAFPRAEAAKMLESATKATSITRVMVKPGREAARKLAGTETLAGSGSWKERVDGHPMRVSAPSFFQVNTAGAEALVRLVMEGLDPQEDEWAVDLYCGAGTFTLPLARRCESVVGVESYGPAVRDLAKNLKANGLEDVVEAVGDDAARQLDCLEDADVVVVDPPRAGLDRSVIEALSDSPARAVAYVSCDPATLARDLAVFDELGQLVPESVTPVDLFPQTFHVENVTVLRRK